VYFFLKAMIARRCSVAATTIRAFPRSSTYQSRRQSSA